MSSKAKASASTTDKKPAAKPKAVDFSKASDEEAAAAVKAGDCTDRDVPGKLYRRKADGFPARIPDYTWNAYDKVEQAKWERVGLPTAEEVQED